MMIYQKNDDFPKKMMTFQKNDYFAKQMMIFQKIMILHNK